MSVTMDHPTMLQDLPTEMTAFVVAFCDFRSLVRLLLVGDRCLFEFARKQLEVLRPYARHHMFREIVSFFDRESDAHVKHVLSSSYVTLRDPPTILIVGKRISGKTTLVRHIENQFPNLCDYRSADADVNWWKTAMKNTRMPILILDDLRFGRIADRMEFWTMWRQSTSAIIVTSQSEQTLWSLPVLRVAETRECKFSLPRQGPPSPEFENIKQKIVDRLTPHVQIWNKILGES